MHTHNAEESSRVKSSKASLCGKERNATRHHIFSMLFMGPDLLKELSCMACMMFLLRAEEREDVTTGSAIKSVLAMRPERISSETIVKIVPF